MIGIGNGVTVRNFLELTKFLGWRIDIGVTKGCVMSCPFNIWYPVVFQSV